MKFLSIVILATVITIKPELISAQSPLRIHHNKSYEAYEKHDYQTFVFHLEKADSISPNHPTITYNLAAGHALIGNDEKSLELLRKAVLMNTKLYPLDDADFKNVIGLPAFKKIGILRESLLVEVTNSEEAFRNYEQDLHPESIAFDPNTGSFLFGSVHKNKIVNYDIKTGKLSDWNMTSNDGLWAVMGIRVDAKRDVLWVCTAVTKEMANYDESLEGKTALLKYDLKTKKLISSYEEEGGHWFGDLVLKDDGTPFISDSIKPLIYTIENDQLIVFKDFTKELFNLQGLAFDSAEKMLFMSDYKLGLYSYNMLDNQLNKISYPDDMTTKGIDGLYHYEGRLLAIHNGVRPFRICEYQLDKSGTKITNIKYIDRGRKELGEPTLGVIAEDLFYYIANSPWGKYDKNGNLKEEELTDNIVLKYDLKK